MDKIVWHTRVTGRDPHGHVVADIAYSTTDKTNSVLAITEPPEHHLHTAIAAPTATSDN